MISLVVNLLVSHMYMLSHTVKLWLLTGYPGCIAMQ